ncbi:hypothetical protein VP01_637g8 [Puccinia sorghi]|uniref:Uncharacterized protein n=1 Tax=Puccinia sorghi TaxID=27349 RepID=A0A0L6UI33_9BASI|nr:hypothetical protein VP01_637g8 [Puccinia sorghi]
MAAPFLPTSHTFLVLPTEQENMGGSKGSSAGIFAPWNCCACWPSWPVLPKPSTPLVSQAQFRAAVCLLSEMEILVNQIAFSAGSATSDTPGGADKQGETTLHRGVQVVSQCKSMLIQLSRMLGGGHRSWPEIPKDLTKRSIWWVQGVGPKILPVHNGGSRMSI